MTDPYGAIYAAVERHRAELLRMERAAASEMVRAYGLAWRRMQTRISKLVREYQKASAANTAVSPAWVHEYNRLNDLMAQVEGELRTLHGAAYRRTVRSERAAIEASTRDMRELISIVGDPGISAQFNRVPLEAMRDMVGTLRNGTPLRALIDGLGVEASSKIREELLAGLAMGEGPRAIARRVRAAFGGDLSRALRISRTECLRAYRTATNEHYQANDQIINGWRWLSAKGPRTCAACLALDGSWHPSSEVQQDHPNGRCSSVPALRNRDNPGAPAPWETGSQWLAKQTPEVQQQVLGKGTYEAYKSGAVTLQDLRGDAYSPVWGHTPRVRPLAQVVGPEEAARWADVAAGKVPESEPHVLGYTWNREPFDTVAAARAAGEAEGGWAAHERAFKEEYLPRFKVKDGVERTIGLWDTPEPSFNARVRGEAANVLDLAKAWGADHGQDAVAVLLPDAQGTGGRLVWDLGRRLSDSELDTLLAGVRSVNERLAGVVARRFGLEEYTVGLTVRQDRLVELWVASSNEHELGDWLVRAALETAKLSGPEARWHGGYDFRLLWKGTDY